MKTLVALTKHHPKFVCNEILNQPIPFEEHVIEYWHNISSDPELTGIILDNFLVILSSSCLYETNDNSKSHPLIATIQPFAIVCVLNEMFMCKEITSELRTRFSDLFAMLLTTLATYTNLAPPIVNNNGKQTVAGETTIIKTTNSKFFKKNETIKLNPCKILLETFQSFLNRLEMEQVSLALSASNSLATSENLENFMEILTPLTAGLVNQLSVNSSAMKSLITSLNKYISSPYDAQRIAAIGLFSQVVPLKPCGEISSVIVLHLLSSLCDPNPIVRGLCIKGLGYISNLSESDVEKFSEPAMSSLLKGIDDYNSTCFIDIPLESMRGLSRTLKTISCDKLDMFQVTLSIRIRPFFENPSIEIREAAIVLFGDLCYTKINSNQDEELMSKSGKELSDAFREQLFSNFFSLLLHLSELESRIVRACKLTLRNVCQLLDAPELTSMAKQHLIDYGKLHYEAFITDFIKIIVS